MNNTKQCLFLLEWIKLILWKMMIIHKSNIIILYGYMLFIKGLSCCVNKDFKRGSELTLTHGDSQLPSLRHIHFNKWQKLSCEYHSFKRKYWKPFCSFQKNKIKPCFVSKRILFHIYEQVMDHHCIIWNQCVFRYDRFGTSYIWCICL